MAQNAAQTGYDQQSPLFKSKQSFWLKFFGLSTFCQMTICRVARIMIPIIGWERTLLNHTQILYSEWFWLMAL